MFKRMDFAHLYPVPPKPEDDGTQAMSQNMNMGRRQLKGPEAILKDSKQMGN